MRGNVGDIATAPGGIDFSLRFLNEVTAVVNAVGKKPRESFSADARALLTQKESTQTSDTICRLSPACALRSSSAFNLRRVAMARSPRASNFSQSMRPKPDQVPVMNQVFIQGVVLRMSTGGQILSMPDGANVRRFHAQPPYPPAGNIKRILVCHQKREAARSRGFLAFGLIRRLMSITAGAVTLTGISINLRGGKQGCTHCAIPV
jgi:hypothetical protein